MITQRCNSLCVTSIRMNKLSMVGKFPNENMTEVSTSYEVLEFVRKDEVSDIIFISCQRFILKEKLSC
jgi:hypothetical protein